MAEFDLIREHFLWHTRPASVHVGVGDDAAVLALPDSHLLAVSVDTLNSGVHFPPETSPYAIGYKALAVNLSDLAAMGATPAWFTLALSLPEADNQWLGEFARGMKALASHHGIILVGGDTTRGPLSVTIQVMGTVLPGKALLRSGAHHGDRICVSGTLGDASAGLAVVQGRLHLPPDAAAYCVQRLEYPSPRVALGQGLSGRAHACIDVSDGLLADLGHVLKASGMGARLFHQQLPCSPVLQALPKEQRLAFALAGGDDFELVFTLPQRDLAEVQQQVAKLGILVTVIGEVDKNLNNLVMDYSMPVGKYGYEHFS